MKTTLYLLSFILISIAPTYAQQGWFWKNPYPSPYDLNDVHLINSNTGFTVGHNGTIIKTTDGGDNWVIQNISPETSVTN